MLVALLADQFQDVQPFAGAVGRFLRCGELRRRGDSPNSDAASRSALIIVSFARIASGRSSSRYSLLRAFQSDGSSRIPGSLGVAVRTGSTRSARVVFPAVEPAVAVGVERADFAVGLLVDQAADADPAVRRSFQVDSPVDARVVELPSGARFGEYS